MPLFINVSTSLQSNVCVVFQLSKSNSQYHKIFKEVSKEELLRQSYTCALQKDILYQGRLFVSDNWIGFHSKVFGKDTKITLPVVSVTHIKKTKTAILVPNALVIATATDRHVFVSFLSRDNTYKFLMSVCLHLEEKSPCSSPVPSSAEHSFRCQRSPRSDLDGAVRQRRQDMEESSSSDSQTPDYDKLAGSSRRDEERRQRHTHTYNHFLIYSDAKQHEQHYAGTATVLCPHPPVSFRAYLTPFSGTSLNI
uniref:GRAM domain containing 2B n=1 Tax=Myripristis murdjan TaxID=586833 RepID=A0A667WQV5_9TELE